MKKYRVLLLIFFLLTCLLPIICRPVLSSDGFTQMRIASEMLNTNNFTIPNLLGEEFYEKPILGYWVTGVSFIIFGENSFAARLPGVLALGMLAYLIWLLVTKRTEDEILALLSCALYLTFCFAHIGGTSANVSTLSVLFISGAISLFYLASSEKFYAIRISYLIGCGLMLGLGFLCVGFVAYIITFAVTAVYLLSEGRIKKVFILPLLPLFCSLFIIMPWMTATFLADKDFAWKFIKNTHFQQYFSAEDNPIFWWQSVPLIMAGTLPASIFALPSLVGILSNLTVLLRNTFFRFLIFWGLVPFLLFVIMDNPQPEYILAVYPPLAIILAMGIKQYLLSGRSRLMDFAVKVAGWSFVALALYILLTQSLLPMESKFVLYTSHQLCAYLLQTLVFLLSGIALLLSQKFNPTSQIIIFMTGVGISSIFFNCQLPGKYFPDPKELIVASRNNVPSVSQKNDLILTDAPELLYQLVWYLDNPNVKVLSEVPESPGQYFLTGSKQSLSELRRQYNATLYCYLKQDPLTGQYKINQPEYVKRIGKYYFVILPPVFL